MLNARKKHTAVFQERKTQQRKRVRAPAVKQNLKSRTVIKSGKMKNECITACSDNRSFQPYGELSASLESCEHELAPLCVNVHVLKCMLHHKPGGAERLRALVCVNWNQVRSEARTPDEGCSFLPWWDPKRVQHTVQRED